jgi:predicted enzyme related to lactoylglutathione lyase
VHPPPPSVFNQRTFITVDRKAVADSTPFEGLDFIYVPSRDVARDLAFYRDVLGGEIVFAIEAMGTRVAQVRLVEDGPRLLLAGHLEGEAPVLIHRVRDLGATLTRLQERGARIESRFGIPHGPCATLRAPAGQRLAVYELTRPEADARFAGRIDFAPASLDEGPSTPRPQTRQ